MNEFKNKILIRNHTLIKIFVQHSSITRTTHRIILKLNSNKNFYNGQKSSCGGVKMVCRYIL